METGQYRGLTDAQWSEGWDELKATLPDREIPDPLLAARRGSSYRRELGHLTSEQWTFAVRAAVRSCRWFPTIAELIGFASELPAPSRLALPEDTRTREERRADAVRGLQVMRDELAKLGVAFDAETVGKSIPVRYRKRATVAPRRQEKR